MSGRDLKDIWLPRFLREAGVRRALTALYVGLIGSSENARLLLDNDLDAIKPESAYGNPVTVYCFRFSIRWLKYLKEFSVSQKAFLEQFLEPARAVARFILAAREAAPYSMPLHGLVFLKSPPFYDKAFGDNMCTLAILVPELNSVLSMRCRREQADSVTYGEYCIHGTQPVPFVNRAHPTKLEIETLDNTIDPFDLGFCKLSFKDLDNIDNLLAFENLSELWSEQIYDINRPRQGRRLGLFAILGGKVLTAGSGPYVTIQDPCGSQSSCTFFVSQKVLKSLNMDLLELEELRGKLVKFMAIFWYRYGSIKFTPQCPEIINLKFVHDEHSLVKDDLVGFVRLRNKSDLKVLGARYNSVDLSSLPKPLVLRDGRLTYDFSISGTNRIARIFSEQQALIRAIRENAIFEINGSKEIEPFILPEHILNTERLELKGMAEWIFGNKPLLNCLVALLMKRDLNGELPSTYKKFITNYPKFGSFFSVESFLWLKNLDLIKVRKGKSIQVTERGLIVAHLAVEEVITNPLKKVLSEKSFIDFVGLETRIPAPPSILLKALHRLKEKGVITYSIIDGAKCELFWIPYGKKEAVQNDDALSDRIKSLQNQVMGVLNSVHYPLHTIAVLQRIRDKGENLSYPAIVMLLSRLADQKRIIKNKSGFWFYPLKVRVFDVLRENLFEAFTTEEIAIKVSLAPMPNHLLELNTILKELKQDRAIEEVMDGYWSLPTSNNLDRRKQILINACRKIAMRLLERSSVGRDELLYEIVTFVASAKKRIQTTEPSLQIATEVINKMFETGEIIREDNYVKLVQKLSGPLRK